MKLMMVIVRDIDADNVLQALIDQGIRVTRVASSGGFLRRGNTTLMVGVEEEKVKEIFELLRQVCSPADSEQHRATVFVLNMAHFEQI